MEYFVAMYGGANDAWNFMRRTGHPRHLALGIMDSNESGPFPRTGTYPSGEISANPSILQLMPPEINCCICPHIFGV